MSLATFRQSQDAPKFQRRDLPPGNTFTRPLTARVLASIERCPASEIAARMWPSDRITAEIIERAASAPAMTSVAGWAAELAQKRIVDTLEVLGPMSAGAQVLKEGLVLTFDGAGSISAPGFVAEYGNAGFVAEGSPIPVRQLNSTAVTLNPYKLAAISVLTREMIQSSNAERLIGETLMRAAGRMLDEVLVDANPASASRPAGLRLGVSALTASTATDAYEAFVEDVRTLVDAVSVVGGGGPYIFIGSPGRAASMIIRFIEQQPMIHAYGSNAIINDLLCIAPAGIVSALSPDPTVESGNAATLHMDTVPQPVGSVGPHKSMFQTDSVALKMRWPVTWALRDSRAFAWLTPTAWK